MIAPASSLSFVISHLLIVIFLIASSTAVMKSPASFTITSSTDFVVTTPFSISNSNTVITSNPVGAAVSSSVYLPSGSPVSFSSSSAVVHVISVFASFLATLSPPAVSTSLRVAPFSVASTSVSFISASASSPSAFAISFLLIEIFEISSSI